MEVAMSTDALTPRDFTEAFDELAAWLQANDNFQGKSWSREHRRWLAERDMRREAVLDAWAAYYGGLVQTKRRHWQGLFHKHAPQHYSDSLTPESDHYSAWRYAGRNKPTEVVVSQPYCRRVEFSDWLPDFIAFANQYHLCFWISERPGWYVPGRVLHIEWTRPHSEFAQRRDTTQAHESHRTLYCHYSQPSV
jgi:hypothetical protein